LCRASDEDHTDIRRICIGCHADGVSGISDMLHSLELNGPSGFLSCPPLSWLDLMSSFPSSNRYPPLGEQDEVRLEMEELSQAQQATGPGWQDSIREALTVALSASLLPPAKLETKPPLRRRSWPILAAEDRMNELSERRDDMQKTKAASLPELREKASPDEVSDWFHTPRL